MAPTKTEAELRQIILQEEERYAAIVEKLEGRLAGPAGPITDHEERIRALEKWQWKTVGVHMCVGILVMAFTGICTSIVTKNIEQVLEKIPAATARR